MKTPAAAKNREKIRRKAPPVQELEVIPAPTIFWHPSISLEKLISDFAEYQDSIIVS
jgi:hypothetical protein